MFFGGDDPLWSFVRKGRHGVCFYIGQRITNIDVNYFAPLLSVRDGL